MRICNFENKKCYSIANENDLQLEVVKLLRKSGLLFSCSHTTEMLDTDGKRIDAKKQGYTDRKDESIAMRIRKPRTAAQLKASRDESYGKFGSAAKKSGKINR